ncbi:MAG: nucleotidyltransferase family protein [Rhodobacteraceae bacterium]|nr:nucleotidyltransferase family protein [Paracoccaceae bacterium]
MHCVLLAAGASRRMGGRDKLLEEIEGLPVLRRQALAVLAAGIGPVAVTLPATSPGRAAALEGLAVTALPVPDAAEGMSASLRTAALWAAGHPLMICPADMPELTTADFSRMAAAFDGGVLRGVDVDGCAGHPVVFPAALLPRFAGLHGDEGARSLVRAHPPRLIALPGRHATTDLDTPEDWAAWRAGPASSA